MNWFIYVFIDLLIENWEEKSSKFISTQIFDIAKYDKIQEFPDC